MGRLVIGRETARMEVEEEVEAEEGMVGAGARGEVGATGMETAMGETAGTLDAQVVLTAVMGVEGTDLAHMTVQVGAGVGEVTDIKLD